MRLLTIIGILLAAVLSAAISPGPEDGVSQAEKLWSEIAGYNEWAIAAGSNLMMPGQAPHGRFVTIYANDIATETISENAEAMPDGAVFAKDNFDSVKRLLQVTVMAKREGSWFWAVYDADGKVKRAGALEGCIACHNGAGRDMVFTWPKASQEVSR